MWSEEGVPDCGEQGLPLWQVLPDISLLSGQTLTWLTARLASLPHSLQGTATEGVPAV